MKDVTSHHIYGTDIDLIVDRMKEVSSEIESRAREMGDIEKMVLRNDPQIKTLWRRLCLLHMRGLVLCEDVDYLNEGCTFIKEPQVCQKVLGIPREETCCGRFFGI